MAFPAWAQIATTGFGIGSRLQQMADARKNRQQEDENRQLNEALQREFAQQGIRWRVFDAEQAGIHPLYALGANTTAFSPIQVGGAGYNTGEILGDMGQDIGRAINATRTQGERSKALMDLELEHRGLQNDLLRSQIAQINQAPNPPLPSNSGLGGGLAGQEAYVVETPLRRVHSQPGNPAQEVGAIPDYGYARTSTGLAIVPSNDVKQRIEDTIIPESLWSFRNHLLPSISDTRKPPDPRYYPLPKGYTRWEFNPLMQEYQPAGGYDDPYRWGKRMRLRREYMDSYKKRR